jgi:hypothetical protein
MSNTQLSTETFSINTLAVSRGKGSDALTKARLAHKQGAYMGLLIGEKVQRKAIIDDMVNTDENAMATAIADAKYARPMATIVAISQRPFTYSETNGDVPRADWKRLNAELKAHDSKAAAKALAVFNRVQATADLIRTQREASKA